VAEHPISCNVRSPPDPDALPLIITPRLGPDQSRSSLEVIGADRPAGARRGSCRAFHLVSSLDTRLRVSGAHEDRMERAPRVAQGL